MLKGAQLDQRVVGQRAKSSPNHRLERGEVHLTFATSFSTISSFISFRLLLLILYHHAVQQHPRPPLRLASHFQARTLILDLQ